MREISLEKLGTLQAEPLVTSASGLVRAADRFYVVGDAESELFSFSESELRLQRIPIFPETLPEDPVARKKVKPDLEALTWWGSRLFLVPSGSKPQRMRAALYSPSETCSSATFQSMPDRPSGSSSDLSSARSFNGGVQVIDMSPLYESLLRDLPDLNIEGAVVSEDCIHLFQRGNGKGSQNAIITLNRAEAEAAIRESGCIPASVRRGLETVDLGRIEGVSLGFTDAALASDGSLWFLSAAESGESTYEDGEFVGAALGCLTPSGGVVTFPLAIQEKPEGLWIEKSGIFYIVTDADDPKVPSGFYRGQLPSIS